MASLQIWPFAKCKLQSFCAPSSARFTWQRNLKADVDFLDLLLIFVVFALDFAYLLSIASPKVGIFEKVFKHVITYQTPHIHKFRPFPGLAGSRRKWCLRCLWVVQAVLDVLPAQYSTKACESFELRIKFYKYHITYIRTHMTNVRIPISTKDESPSIAVDRTKRKTLQLQ